MNRIIPKIMVGLLAFVAIVPLYSVSANNGSRAVADASSLTGRVVDVEDLYSNKDWQEGWNDYLKREVGDNYKELLDRNWQSLQRAEKIKSLFPARKESARLVYPEYIGGLYINKEDFLTVQVVKKNVPSVGSQDYLAFQKTIEIAGQDIDVEYVEYSYEQLNSVYETILSSFKKGHAVTNIKALYIDEMSNRVIVELGEYTEDKIKAFKETVSDSGIVWIKRGKEASFFHNPGGTLANICSLGYRARKTNATSRTGIITANHCFGNMSLTVPGIGTVTERTTLGGDADAAWIEGNATKTNTLNKGPNNTSPGPALSTSVVNSFTVGQRVGKVGISSAYTIGTVTNISYATILDGWAYWDLVNTTAWAQGGDSGGIVFAATSNTATHTTAGIVTGGPAGGGQFFFTKASVINSRFGLQRY